MQSMGGTLMTITAPNFYRNLGLTGGSLWLVMVGVAFANWSLAVIGSPFATSALVLVSTTALALFAYGVHLFRSVRRLHHGPVDDSSRSRRRRMGRQFGMIFAAEAIACTAVALLCAHHWQLIPPLTLVIVGLHFLPLARLFEVPRYFITGALFCVIPIATLVTVSSSAHIGHAVSWIAISAIGCGLVALATGLAGLVEVQRFLNDSSMPLPVCA
jgi:hypothetical protein